jgi:hypothetical protein
MAHAAVGYLITDWGDLGHFQPLPVSYPGLHLGAALAWNPDAEVGPAMERSLGVHVLGDPTGEAGRLLWEYGRLHKEIEGHDDGNSARVVMSLLRGADSRIDDTVLRDLPERYQEAAESLDQGLARAALSVPDAGLIRQEMRHAVRADVIAARFARQIRRGDETTAGERADLLRDLDAWIQEHRAVWLQRNRAGGLEESVQFLDKAANWLCGES